ncbi:DMT family transporter [Polaribacter sp. AHE13PA]|jgi:drug/metabolite transporter (DMT)-like permease|uniref:DMT family transporter n=1 Tax=unclassified Polaribacter TaxID=196858 RepID=UPI0020C7A840|nr:DMT family transporter [Polaribacter sp. AHE13PA]
MKSSTAIFYMIFSVIAFSLMNAVVKYLGAFDAYQIVFFRSIGTLLFTVPLIIKAKIPILGNNKKLLFLRGLFGVISLTCFFMSLNYLSLGTAVSLRYTSPIFGAIFALFFLKEKIKSVQWVLFLIAFIGVLVIKGFGADVNSLGVIFAILSAIFLGLIFIVIRKLGDSENPLVIINYFMILAFSFGGIMSIKYWKTPNLTEWLLLLSLGFFGYVGQLYMTKSLQSGETNVVVPLKYLEVVFMIVIGAFWFDEIYNLWTLLGVCLIMFGLLYNIYLKRKRS